MCAQGQYVRLFYNGLQDFLCYLWEVLGDALEKGTYARAEETAKIVDQLKKGKPSIWVRYRRENTILMNTLFLDDGDEKVIVRARAHSILYHM